jgi:hypothetical protein
MGATVEPDLADGEAEFAEIASPGGFGQQFIAGLEAAEKLKNRLGITGHPTIIWPHAFDAPPPLSGYRDRSNLELEEPDPADWWKRC